MSEEHVIEFDNQGNFTGFAYACKGWGFTIVDTWYIEDGFAAIKYKANK